MKKNKIKRKKKQIDFFHLYSDIQQVFLYKINMPTSTIRTVISSIILVTIGAEYSNEYVEGSRTMIWEGQKSGERDQRVVRGTRVWFRKNKNKKCFRLLGTIERVQQISLRTATQPAKYILTLNLFDEANQVEVQRDAADTNTYQTILRSEGFDENVVRGAVCHPHGIY
jgi:hypothetical protein